MSNPQETPQEAVRHLGIRAFTFQIVIALIAAGIFLGTHFLLNSWAEASEVHHNVEHIIIFLSGSTFGSALFSMLRSRNSR